MTIKANLLQLNACLLIVTNNLDGDIFSSYVIIGEEEINKEVAKNVLHFGQTSNLANNIMKDFQKKFAVSTESKCFTTQLLMLI